MESDGERARDPEDPLRLEHLVADALPTSGAVALSGSMLLGRSSKLPPFVVHVKPVVDPQPDSERGPSPPWS